MRLVTRGDLDSLTCAVIISLHEEVDEVLLTHPQKIADGRIEIHGTDIIANLPFQKGCALWFDHHQHTTAKAPTEPFEGVFGQAPSAARLAYEYYGGLLTMPQLEDLVHETDRLDSADLTLDDILDPQGYIQLGYTVDSRTGLGNLNEYFMTLLDLLATNTSIEQILAHPEVEERCGRLEMEDIELHAALKVYSEVDGNVVVTDFRDLDPVPVGNRFLVFAVYPKINVEVRVQWRKDKKIPMLTLGHSIINRTCNTDVGELAARYGGGGHRGAGSLPLREDPDKTIAEVVAELKANG
jgi:oligoribonuclease NrnB/cAMP/cGMP phosphodiesterase (DHH superfamily)